MSLEWKTYTVEELVNKKMLDKPLDGNHGGIHPKSSDYVDKGVPFIMANDLKNGSIDYENCKYISEEQAKTLKKGFSKPGDVLLTHKATIGRTAIVDNIHDTIILTPQVTYYRVLKGINNYYLYFYFNSSYFQNILQNWSSSGSTRSYIGISNQLKLPIVLPPLEIQNNIVSILSKIDKKITINEKINKNLEQLIKYIYINWFEEFEPFKDRDFYDSKLGSIPVGWEVLPLQKFIKFQEGPGIRNWQYVEEDGINFLNIRCIQNNDLVLDTANMISQEEANGKYAHFMLNEWDLVISSQEH